jgi:hypothetical protein
MRAVNLIPADQRTAAGMGAGRSEGAAYAVVVLLGGAALLAFLYGRAEHQIASQRAQAASLSARAQRAQTQASQLAPYTSFIALREQRVNDVSALVDSRFDWAHAFHEFGRVLPSGISVSSLSGTLGSSSTAGGASGSASSAGASASSPPSTGSPASNGGASSTVTSATPPGSIPQFTISGCAVSQPAVAVMLERLRLIDGVSGVTLQSSTKAASGGGSGAAGGCPAGDPQYTTQVIFNPLPAPATTTAAIAAVAAHRGSINSSGTGGAR